LQGTVTVFTEAWRVFLGRVDACAPGLARELYELGQAVLVGGAAPQSLSASPSASPSSSASCSYSPSAPVLQVAWQGREIVAAAGLRFGQPDDHPFTAELIGPAAVPQLRLPVAERLLECGYPGGAVTDSDGDTPWWRQLAVRWINLALITSLLRLAEERQVHECVARFAAGRDEGGVAGAGAAGIGGGRPETLLWERVATCLIAGFSVDPRCELSPGQRRRLRERLGMRPEPKHPPALASFGAVASPLSSVGGPTNWSWRPSVT